MQEHNSSSKTGVLQGSIFGPLLFLIYINASLIFDIIIHADDTTLVANQYDFNNNKLNSEIYKIYKVMACRKSALPNCC